MRSIILFLGDAAIFFFALFCALSIRLGELVSLSFYKQHIIPFSILFVVYTLIMYMFGVYSKEFKYTTRNIFNTLLYATLWLMSFAVILFYLFQFDGVTPKTNLVLFGIVLFVLSLIWHTQVRQVAKSVRSKVIIIGGPECPLDFDVVRIVPLDMDNKLILNVIASSNVNKVLINFNHPKVLELLPSLYTLMLSGVSFINLGQIEEDDMGKVNLKTIDKRWILHSLQDKHIRLYRLAKRVIDIVVVLLLVPVCIIICPLVIAALKIQYLLGAGASKALIKQERIGLNRRIFKLYKFRSMICDDTGVWHNDISKVVTPLGKFLRKSRIDELPQLFNILRGDMSLVGPRPDMVNLGKVLSTEIDYYDTRYIVQPGLTGWAQVSQRIIPQSINENKSRLEYDLYYIKNQSLFLELDIILKTMRRLLIDVFTK